MYLSLGNLHRRRLLPAGLLGALALMATVEQSLARRWPELASPAQLAWRYHAAPPFHPAARQADTLVLGDSLVNLGVVPRIIDVQHNSSTYNLAVPGGQAFSSYFLLRRVLASGAQPRSIVIDFSALYL